MRIFLNWLMSAVAIIVVAYLLPGVHVATFVTALAVALVLGLINAFIRPVLLILTLPITILTLGLFTLVINAAMVMLTARFVPGFTVDGFWWALAFGLLLWIVNSFFRDARGNA